MAQDNETQSQDSERVAMILNQQKADARRKEEQPDAEKESEDTEEVGGEDNKRGGLRQRVAAAREALNLKAKAKKKIEEKIKSPARNFSKALLKGAWEWTMSFFGFIPGLLYINFHAFMRITPLSSLFCELGTEWVPSSVEQSAESAGLAGWKIAEKMLLAAIDVLFTIVAVIIFAVLKYVYDHSILSWVLEKILL